MAILRPANESDMTDVIAVCQDAIWNLASKFYTEEQCRVWAESLQDHQRIRSVITEGMAIVAEDQQGIVAFGQLDPVNHVNLLYCRARGKGQGIAAQILTALETEATRHTVNLIYTEASLTARGFFEKHGYQVIEREVVTRKGVPLSRFKMSKAL